MTSYAERYRLLCEKLMEQKIYNAASLIMSPKPDKIELSTWHSMSKVTAVQHLFAQLSAQLLVENQI